MAWTALTYAYGSVLTSAKMTQNQDNFTALANGDSGAPQHQTASYADGSITADKIVLYTPGTSYRLIQSTSSSGTISTSWDTLKEALCGSGGTVTVTYTHSSGSTASHYTNIFVNDVAVGTVRSANGTYSENITISPGDELQVKGYITSGFQTVDVSYFYIQSALPPFALFNMQIA